MKRECEVCGSLQDEQWMMSFSSGRKTHWFCWECWKVSQYEASKNDLRRAKAISKEKMLRGTK